LPREGIADSNGVRPDNIALKLFEFGMRDADIGQETDTGVDAVHRIVAPGQALYDGPRSGHLFERFGSDAYRFTAHRNGLDLLDRQVAAIQDHHMALG
jgi:hypothetical protein